MYSQCVSTVLFFFQLLCTAHRLQLKHCSALFSDNLTTRTSPLSLTTHTSPLSIILPLHKCHPSLSLSAPTTNYYTTSCSLSHRQCHPLLTLSAPTTTTYLPDSIVLLVPLHSKGLLVSAPTTTTYSLTTQHRSPCPTPQQRPPHISTNNHHHLLTHHTASFSLSHSTAKASSPASI